MYLSGRVSLSCLGPFHASQAHRHNSEWDMPSHNRMHPPNCYSSRPLRTVRHRPTGNTAQHSQPERAHRTTDRPATHPPSTPSREKPPTLWTPCNGGSQTDPCTSKHKKCQTMHTTNTRNIIQSTYTIHNHNLQTTNTAKYLGIHIHSTLKWSAHINKNALRANTTSSILHRNIRKCPGKTKHLAYTTLVRPILEYTSIIIFWDPHPKTLNSTTPLRQPRHAHLQ